MRTSVFTLLIFSLSFNNLIAQNILTLGKQSFELHNVTGSIIRFQGAKVLKIERDLNAIPFDAKRLEATVDEPHYAKLVGLEDFENGTIEVKMYSQIQDPSPYPPAAGFIGLFYRVAPKDTAFESIYLRPKVGRADKQFARNHAVQYFAYPHAKFATLREKYPAGNYEGSAPVALNEWITMRLEINGETAEMFINNMKYSSFIVDKMLSNSKSGGVGLYVDIGTIGYFKDLKVTKKKLVEKKKSAKIGDI
ncbi:MAG: hypothetical protein RLZZ546_1008 [Bacteroidota bacterium]|jgi:hypothetical protein